MAKLLEKKEEEKEKAAEKPVKSFFTNDLQKVEDAQAAGAHLSEVTTFLNKRGKKVKQYTFAESAQRIDALIEEFKEEEKAIKPSVA